MDNSNYIRYEDFFRFGPNPVDHGDDGIFIDHPSGAFQIADGVKFIDIVKFDHFELGQLDELRIAASDSPLNACDYLTNSVHAFKRRNDFLGNIVDSLFKGEGHRLDVLIDRFELVHKNFGAFLDHLLSAYRLFPETARPLLLSDDGKLTCNVRTERLEAIPRLAAMANS